MRTTFILLIIFSLSLSIFAQKVDKVSVIYDYNRLPLKPLDKGVTVYQGIVVLEYAKAIEADKQKAEDDYQKGLAEYPKQIKAWEEAKLEAEEKFNKEMEEYKQKSTATKIIEKQILEQNTKPVLVIPPKPYPPVKRESTYQKVFDESVLNSTYIKLDGYAKGSDNPAVITVTLHGFENTEPEIKTSKSSVYNSSTKTTSEVTSYWYEMKYKHPISVKVEDPYNGVICNEMITGSSEFSVYKTASKENAHPNFNKNNVLADLQDKIVEINMKSINQFINSQFGYSKVRDTLTLYRIEAKKFNYDDYQQAFEAANLSYNLLAADYNTAVEKLNTAISTWFKILEEFNPDDKKGRITTDIALATYLNLATAYIWLNEYLKTEEMLLKISTLKPTKNDQKRIEALKEFSRGQKLRWEANK
jgi:hypothetical protein